MNGKVIGFKPLYVAVTQRKEERKARLQLVLFLKRRFMFFEEVCIACGYWEARETKKWHDILDIFGQSNDASPCVDENVGHLVVRELPT
ncbi:hypothetical protein IFM89_001286 [Coptis chinensis]|uniref:Uncharacterized protein n=1 Tax=Coptis chinensis TaxID=261450 RepID=A0A835MGY9_9MAGN|nr:hypothetical protein IFM89_001286 [Coptis chinensis]